MLGQTLVTKQTGPAGKPVNVLYIASKLSLEREMYFALLLDRQTAGAFWRSGPSVSENLGTCAASPLPISQCTATAIRSNHA